MRCLFRAAPSFFVALCLLAPSAFAQIPESHGHGRELVFPDIPGYRTLGVDLHTHSVFSDGSVWPDIRVREAQKDGLDALAITEHLEYQPHADDIPHPDRNRAFEVARDYLEGRLEGADPDAESLILIAGSEITRYMPPGHSNAVFIQDANPLLTQDVPTLRSMLAEEAIADAVRVFRMAKEQGAFVFWNHPHWVGQQPDGVATLTDTHRQLIEEGLIQGIEVVNDITYSPEAHAIALEHDLAILGTSDVHGLVDWRYQVAEGGHRPISLVFARERTAESLKEALFARRTVAITNHILVGKEEFLRPLVEASLTVSDAHYDDDENVLQLELSNNSSSNLVLENKGALTFHNRARIVSIPEHSTLELQVKTLEQKQRVTLEFDVLNAMTAPESFAPVEIAIDAIEVRD